MKPSNDPLDVVTAISTLFGSSEEADAPARKEAEETLRNWRRDLPTPTARKTVAYNCMTKLHG